MPSADFRVSIEGSCNPTSSPVIETETRISWGKFEHFHRTPVGCTAQTLDGMDFAVRSPLVRYALPVPACCSSGRDFVPRFLQTPPYDDALALH